MVQKTVREVIVRNKAGEEFRWNTTFVKKHKQASRWCVQIKTTPREENSLLDKVRQRQKIVPQPGTGVFGNIQVSLQSSLKKGEETESQIRTGKSGNCAKIIVKC